MTAATVFLLGMITGCMLCILFLLIANNDLQ